MNSFDVQTLSLEKNTMAGRDNEDKGQSLGSSHLGKCK